MENFDNYDDRQRGRHAGSERYSQSDRSHRSDDDSRYGRDDERSSRSSRYGSENEFSNRRPWSGSNGFGSSGSERFTSGGSDRYEYRPQQDYRSLRDDSRFDNRNQRGFNDYEQSFDSHLGGRPYSSGRNDWGHDRSSSYQSPGHYSSSGYGQSSGSGMGSQGHQGFSSAGSYGTQSGFGSSQGYGQGYGSNSFGQGQGSSSNHGSQYGQMGGISQNQQRWGSDSSSSSFQSKAGRGPKGYKRSDERIKEEISDLLTGHHEIDPSEVELKVSNGEVTLTGSVSSRHEKRLVEDLASQISGVTDVTNQLRVQQQSSDSSRFQSSTQDGSNKSSQSQGFGSHASSGQSQSQGQSGQQQSSKSIQ